MNNRIMLFTDTSRRYAYIISFSSYLFVCLSCNLNHLLFLQYDKCREEYDLLHKGKDKVLMRELNKYLVRPRKK
jgi:hypothetical protein